MKQVPSHHASLCQQVRRTGFHLLKGGKKTNKKLESQLLFVPVNLCCHKIKDVRIIQAKTERVVLLQVN